jgi:hypothetical protein
MAIDLRLPLYPQERPNRCAAVTDAKGQRSDFNLLRYRERIVNIDTQISQILHAGAISLCHPLRS